jgi:hypothetical protein
VSVCAAVPRCPDFPTTCGFWGGSPDGVGPVLVCQVAVCLWDGVKGEGQASNTVLLSRFLSRSGVVLL